MPGGLGLTGDVLATETRAWLGPEGSGEEGLHLQTGLSARTNPSMGLGWGRRQEAAEAPSPEAGEGRCFQGKVTGEHMGEPVRAVRREAPPGRGCGGAGGTAARPRVPGRLQRAQASAPQHRSAQGASSLPAGQHVTLSLRPRTTQAQASGPPPGRGPLASGLVGLEKGRSRVTAGADGQRGPNQRWREGGSRRAPCGPSLPCPAPSEARGAVAPWEGGSHSPLEDGL